MEDDDGGPSYRGGLIFCWVLLAPSVLFALGGLASAAWGAQTIWTYAFLLGAVALPVFTFVSIIRGMNLQTRGELETARQVIWRPALGLGLLVILFLYAQCSAIAAVG